MCTAVAYRANAHYFGRNLDLGCSYGEGVTVTPRNFPLPFREMPALTRHYAMIGMAAVRDGYPLYFEATNECGLSMAGLNFPGNAVYYDLQPDKDNVSPFEFIPWILAQCAGIGQARALLSRVNLAKIPFSSALPLSPLHWLLSDGETSLTVEAVADGLHIYENPVGVLTNNPPFAYHMHRLADFLRLTPEQPAGRFGLAPYSLGLGAFGLPGDSSSASRFVRAAFIKHYSAAGADETEDIGQFFRILDAVAMQKGCVAAPSGELEYTLYSCCCNTDTLIYYYTTHENRSITAVDMRCEDLDGRALAFYPQRKQQQIHRENG